MEVIGGIILVFIGWTIFRLILNAGAKTIGAAARTVTGKGSMSDNMEIAFKGMSDFEVRLVDDRLGEKSDGPEFKAIEVKGLFPIYAPVNLGVVISVFDSTEGTLKPMLSDLDMFQEPDTVAYHHSTEIGEVKPDQGYMRWQRVGAVFTGLLNPPKKGNRELSVVIRLIDADDPPAIRAGFCDKEDGGVLATRVVKFRHAFAENGYEEEAENRDKARALSIKIGMAVAMADGSLDPTEGEVLKAWITKAISPYDDTKRDHLKVIYNKAMKESYEAAQKGELSLSDLTAQLNQIAETSSRYETIELCFDVMAADGIADPEELKTIKKIAEALELDFSEIEKLRDQKLIGLDTATDQASVEDLLGIENDWSEDRIKKHLRTEFQKWNDRLNTLAEGENRDNAQRMLNLIADARKKYG